LLYLWLGYITSVQPAATVLAAASAIATAATAQTALGGWLLRRTMGDPALLDRGREVLWFGLLSPLFCLMSASVATATTLALGGETLADSAKSWAAWWLGDTFAVLIGVPLVLMVVGEPRKHWRARALPVGLPLLLSVALFTAAVAGGASLALLATAVVAAG